VPIVFNFVRSKSARRIVILCAFASFHIRCAGPCFAERKCYTTTNSNHPRTSQQHQLRAYFAVFEQRSDDEIVFNGIFLDPADAVRHSQAMQIQRSEATYIQSFYEVVRN
jgi:hypothetical protein